MIWVILFAIVLVIAFGWWGLLVFPAIFIVVIIYQICVGADKQVSQLDQQDTTNMVFVERRKFIKEYRKFIPADLLAELSNCNAKYIYVSREVYIAAVNSSIKPEQPKCSGFSTTNARKKAEFNLQMQLNSY
ncbi:MAG: hypothetical protein SNJ29_15935 [Rikenellaceae bacterium]